MILASIAEKNRRERSKKKKKKKIEEARKAKKKKEGKKWRGRRKEVDLPPRGDTAATSSINNIASWPRSFDI